MLRTQLVGAGAVVDDLLLQRGAQRSYKQSHHPRYTPLQKVEDAAVRAAGQQRFAGAGDTQFWMKRDGSFAIPPDNR